MTTTTEHAHLCPGCFAAKGNASTCPQCGYNESLKRGPLVLPHRTLLHHGQYLIGKVLGKPGGFGITYLALDTKLETRVAIKEYLPRDLAGRDAGHVTISAHSAEDGEFFSYGLTQFLQEARTLAQFDHANIVRVRNFFEENGTGYLVMDYYDGITLADYLAQQPQGKLPEKTAVGILMPILDGLREVHAKNILHRDIKPHNIYLTTANRPILLDFGAARQAMGERSRSLSVVLSEGYAPYEQYHRRGEQGPWTYIYACAAVLYHAVSGEAPPPATERMHKDELDIAALGVSASLAEALRSGLATDHHKRPQRMTEFQALLLGENVVTVAEKSLPASPPASPPPEAKPSPAPLAGGWLPSWAWWLGAILIAALVWKNKLDNLAVEKIAVAEKAEAEKKQEESERARQAMLERALQKQKLEVERERRQAEREATAKQAEAQRIKAERQASANLPVVMVHIPGKNYEIGKYEVTQGQWKAVMRNNPSEFKNCGDTCPVEKVNWDDVQEFIQELNAMTGKRYRLPTGVEWEYACYGGSQSNYCGGNDLNMVGWYGANSNGQTHSVGQKQANGYGLYDMSGNVDELINDCLEGNCAVRMLRGGWYKITLDIFPQAAYASWPLRSQSASKSSYSSIGFRLARTLP